MRFRIVPLHLLLLTILQLPFNTNTSKLKAKVYIFIPVHAYSQSKVLPFTLSGIEAQDYSKDRINVHISFDLYRSVAENTHDEGLLRLRRNRLTYEAIKNWINSNQDSYHDIHLDINYLEDDEDPINKIKKYWSFERIRRLSKLRDNAMKRAKSVWADYIFYIDSDVVLIKEKTLDYLVGKGLPIVSPLIHEAGGQTNLWCGGREDSNGGTIEDYFNIESTKNLGTNFKIALAQSCLLVDTNHEAIAGLRFEGSESPDLPFAEWNGLLKLAKQNNITMYSNNEEIWGYMPRKIERMDLDENELDLIDIELESLRRGSMFPESDSMKPFIERPRKDKLGVDQVYIINLARREDRRKMMNKKIEILGIDAVFWPAVEKLEGNSSMLEHIQIIDRTVPSTQNVIDSSASHYQIYMDSIERDFESVIIFEDDIKFERDFIRKWYKHLKTIEIYEALHGSVDFIYLGRYAHFASEESTVVPGLVLPRRSDKSYGYLVKRSGIDKILASQPFDNLIAIDQLLPVLFDQHPSEILKSRYPERTMKALSVRPCLVHQDQSQFQMEFISDTRSSEVTANSSETRSTAHSLHGSSLLRSGVKHSDNEITITGLEPDHEYLNNPKYWNFGNFTIRNEGRCSSDDDFKVLMLVHSHPDSVEARSAYRKYVPKEFRLVFLFGSGSPSHQMQIEKESEVYGDIVQGSFIEVYRNLTRKHIMGLTWAALYCPTAPFVLKSDDDIVYNYTTILNYIESFQSTEESSSMEPSPTKLFIIGEPNFRVVHRDRPSKWYVSPDEYPDEMFPEYFIGWTYFTSIDTIKELLNQVPSTPFFWLDDVYVTGLLRNKCPRIQMHGIPLTWNWEVSKLSEWISDSENCHWPYTISEADRTSMNDAFHKIQSCETRSTYNLGHSEL